MLSRLAYDLRGLHNLIATYTTTDPSREVIYRSLFLRELSFLAIADTFYPVGSAANHSLLYLVARAMRNFEFKNVVELGAGQTTLLIDQVMKSRTLSSKVQTLEHDRFWADSIQKQVAHPIARTDLRPLRNPEYQGLAYDFSPVEVGPIDFLLVDGPPAYDKANRHARLGALDLVERLGNEFVVVVDDAHRPGERTLVRLLKDVLRKRKINFYIGEVRALKTQAVFATDQYAEVAFY